MTAEAMANEDEFAIVSIKAYDINGNPKPNIDYVLDTSFGTLADTTLTTNNDGYACTYLECDGEVSAPYKATITVSGDSDFSFDVPVSPVYEMPYKLVAMPNNEIVQADGSENITVFGQVLTATEVPAPNAVIRYRKGRTIQEVFTNAHSNTVVSEMATPIWGEAGKVVADSSGHFEIGPFYSATPNDPGYWFVAGTREFCSFAAQLTETAVIPSGSNPSQVVDVMKGLWVWGRKVFSGTRAYGAVLRGKF